MHILFLRTRSRSYQNFLKDPCIEKLRHLTRIIFGLHAIPDQKVYRIVIGHAINLTLK